MQEDLNSVSGNTPGSREMSVQKIEPRSMATGPLLCSSTGSAQTGKTFLARRVEALLVADSRHAYRWKAKICLQGLDVDLSAADPFVCVSECVGTVRSRGC